MSTFLTGRHPVYGWPLWGTAEAAGKADLADVAPATEAEAALMEKAATGHATRRDMRRLSDMRGMKADPVEASADLLADAWLAVHERAK